MKKIVVFGGGTGLSNLLDGLKLQPLDITVVVTISDNGGSTGKIRDYYNIPAPGDLRRAVVALSNNSEVNDLMNFRFDENIQNHTIGNLILAAFNELKGDMSEAVKAYCRLLDVSHNIIPISNESLTLCAIMKNNEIIRGESQICKYKQNIKEIFYEGNPHVNAEVLTAINDADAVIFSSGSLYTSIISNLTFVEMHKALNNNKLKKIYVANLATQAGETDKYNLSDHVNAINYHIVSSKIDYVIANNNYDVEKEVIEKYASEGSILVVADTENISCRVLEKNYITISENGHLRHNVKKIGTDINYIVNGGYDN